MKKAMLLLFFVLSMNGPAFGQGEGSRSRCLESTVMFYNCLKGGTEIQRNLGTTYLLGAIQTLAALDLIIQSKDKNMAHFKFEYLDFVEANGSIHNEKPGRGVTMYLLQTYGNTDNPEGLEQAKTLGLIP